MSWNGLGRVARDANGLSEVQRRFLRKIVREPKALSELLKEQRVCASKFAAWRAEPAFERAFRRATAGLTRDTLADLRFTFSLCGKIVSAEVLRIHSGEKPAPGDTEDKLTAEQQRLCFEVIKVGMGAFVPKVLPRRRKRAFPKVDPEAFARLERAQGD
jgi:hypothetical protein